MGTSTGIEWTDATWNPVTGCTRVSTGCDHCYAATLAEGRLRDVYLRQLPVVDTPKNRIDPFASGPPAWTSRFDGQKRGWSSSTPCPISFTTMCRMTTW
jgi:protein gp37